MGKGEIAHYEQFLLFPQCFQKALFPRRQKVSLCGNGLTAKVISWRLVTHMCFLAFSNTTFLFKATNYFSLMLLQRSEAKESLPQLAIELTTTRSWVQDAYHWATQAGLQFRKVLHNNICHLVKWELFIKQQNFRLIQIDSFKAFTDDEKNVAAKMKFALRRG